MPVPPGLAPDGQHLCLWQKAALGLLAFTGRTAQGTLAVPGSRCAPGADGEGSTQLSPLIFGWIPGCVLLSFPQLSRGIRPQPSAEVAGPYWLPSVPFVTSPLTCRCPVPFQAQHTHSAPFLARGPRLPPSCRSATPVPPPAGHLALRRSISTGTSTPWLTEERREREDTQGSDFLCASKSCTHPFFPLVLGETVATWEAGHVPGLKSINLDERR